MALSERDRAILDFERGWWKLESTKEAAIRQHLALSTTRYYELLGRLIDDSSAVEYDPLTVRRLRRLRDQRRRAKFEGREAGPRR